MIDKEIRERIIDLMKREVVPAVGCTEPTAVALCTAVATRLLPEGAVPEHIEVKASANIIKNAMGVGIPGTGMIGLPIAVALGALIGDPDDKLEVLQHVNHEAVERGRKYIEEGRINISLAADAPSILHIDVEVTADGHTARAVISQSHTNVVHTELDGKVLSDVASGSQSAAAASTDDDIELNMRMVHEFATTSPIEELAFILEARRLNYAAATYALAGDYGHSLGATMLVKGKEIWGDTVLCHMVGMTSAACDARMGGAPVAVMSNSGSGNQGITATMPVVVFAEESGASEEQLVRALTLSHLTSIYIKQSLGRLSALCGCVVASTGAASGLVYLMGGGYDQTCAAIKNMVANLAGMICDGAKPSCSMKISSGVSTALLSAMLAMNGRCVTGAEGIVSDDVDASIHNLTGIGREAMTETDRLVLHIMTHKC